MAPFSPLREKNHFIAKKFIAFANEVKRRKMNPSFGRNAH